jgi:glycosyltransferase involved in cell wall biosynthesis
MIYGAVHSMMTLAKAQREHGDAVSFVTFKGKPFGSAVRNLGWDVREVQVRAKLDPFAIAQMRKHFRLQKVDVVQTHLSTSSINGCFAARLAKIPCIGTVHGMSGKLSFIFANHMIGVSKGVKEHLKLQGVPDSKITPVYNGVDLPSDLLSSTEARQKFGIPSDAFVIGTVARMTPLKGVDTVICAFPEIKQQIQNAHLVLVGDGESTGEYKELARSLGISSSASFLGYQQSIFESLASMDMFLFGSQKEALGMAVVEALRIGLPVVSTNVGGLPEVVNDSVGRLVRPKDYQAMSSEVIDIFQSGALQEMSLAAKQRAESLFSVESMYQGTRSVYEALLSNRVQ